MKKLLLSMALLTGCVVTPAGDGTGVDVAQVQAVLSTVQQEVTTWDVNHDGVLSQNEVAALIISLSGRLYLLFNTE